MRTSPRPVLVVCKPPHESTAGVDERGHHIHHLSRILFCTDFSENSERALKYAISLTSEYDAELTLLAYIGEGPTAGQGGRDHSCSDGATGKTDSGGRAQDRKNCDGSADRKSVRANYSIRPGIANRPGDNGSAWPRWRGSGDLRFDNLPGDAVGPCPVLASHV